MTDPDRAEIPAPPTMEPIPAVVELARNLLKDAEAGAARGVALTIVPAGRPPGHRVVFAPDDALTAHLLVTGIALMAQDFGDVMRGKVTATPAAPTKDRPKRKKAPQPGG